MLCEDKVPAGLTRFDVEGFADEIRARFGSFDDEYSGSEPAMVELDIARSVISSLLVALRGSTGGDSQRREDEYSSLRPFVIEVCDFAGFRANWILLECGWAVPDDVFAELGKMVMQRGLHIYGEWRGGVRVK